jgi:predicted RNA-binding protein with PIN domain
MPYLIDGHNLIGAMPDISLNDPNDEMKLVNRLRSFAARRNKQIVVIFDKGSYAGRSPASTHSVEVIFASEHQTTGDELIMRRIKHLRDPRGWTLVTSDGALVGFAKGYRLNIMKSAAFAQALAQIPEPPDLGEWVNPIIPSSEASYWEPLMTAREMPPTAPPRPDNPIAASKQDSEPRTAPKPRPAPTAPRPRPPKPPRPADETDKPIMKNTLDEWMKLFGVDEE